MTIAEELQAAGWDPFSSCDACREATKIPAMFSWLSEMDRFGIYHNYLSIVLITQFGRGTRDGDPRWKELMDVAILFALRRSNLKDRITPEVVHEWAAQLEAWRVEVLRPSESRLESIAPDDVESELRENWRAYEPAVTLAHIHANMGIVNKGTDQKLMSIGRSMHEADSHEPKAMVETSDQELRDYHAWLTTEGTVARISAEGMIEIDPLIVKTRLDSRLGRVVQAKGGTPTPDPDPELEVLVDALARVEQARLVREICAARLRDAQPGSARWHVLRHFDELVNGATTFRDLAREAERSPSALQEAFAEEKAAIRRLLRAA
jgi:hypothetical protein